MTSAWRVEMASFGIRCVNPHRSKPPQKLWQTLTKLWQPPIWKNGGGMAQSPRICGNFCPEQSPKLRARNRWQFLTNYWQVRGTWNKVRTEQFLISDKCVTCGKGVGGTILWWNPCTCHALIRNPVTDVVNDMILSGNSMNWTQIDLSIKVLLVSNIWYFFKIKN
jgi:hypothetical protein